MVKQSLFPPANSVLLQALKTIWYKTKNSQKVTVQIIFDIIIYSEDTDNSLALHTNLQRWHKWPTASAFPSSSLASNAEGLSLITERLMQVFWSYFFLQTWEALNMYYFVGAHAATTLCTSTSHYQVQLSLPIFHSHLSIWLLPTYFKIGAQSVQCKVPNFTPSIFCIPQLLPRSEIYSAFVAVCYIFCFYIARYHIKQVTS